MTYVTHRRGEGTAPGHVQHKLGLGPLCAVLASTTDWVDALDPSLPAEPALPPASVIRKRAKHPHKLVLCGIGFATSASAMAIGYFGAAWALS